MLFHLRKTRFRVPLKKNFIVVVVGAQKREFISRLSSADDVGMTEPEVKKSMVGRPPMSLSEDSDETTDYKEMKEQRKLERSQVICRHKLFSTKMKARIDLLPLPPKLRDFVNYSRS